MENAFNSVFICFEKNKFYEYLYLLLLNLAPCDISIDNGVGPCLRASGDIPNILSLALCPYFMYCFSNPIITSRDGNYVSVIEREEKKKCKIMCYAKAKALKKFITIIYKFKVAGPPKIYLISMPTLP